MEKNKKFQIGQLVLLKGGAYNPNGMQIVEERELEGYPQYCCQWHEEGVEQVQLAWFDEADLISVSEQAILTFGKPLGDKVLIYIPKKEREGMLEIVESSKPLPITGVVMATGKGHRGILTNEYVPLEVKYGDVVFFSKYGGNELELNGLQFVVLQEDQIYMIIPENVNIKTPRRG